MIGWTHSHYSSVTVPVFSGKSRIGPYGDAICESAGFEWLLPQKCLSEVSATGNGRMGD